MNGLLGTAVPLVAVTSLPGIVAAVFGVVALVAAGLFGMQAGTVGFLRSQVDDLEKANARHEKERADDRARIAQLEADLDALTRVKIGQDQLVRMNAQLGTHNTAAESHWKVEERLLGQILTKLGGPQ